MPRQKQQPRRLVALTAAPLPSPGQAALYSRFLEYERAVGGRVAGDWRFKAHLLLPWLWDLVHHPRILATVEAALGTRARTVSAAIDAPALA